MRQVSAPLLTLLALSIVSLQGCRGDDECVRGEVRCDGALRLECDYSSSHVLGSPSSWAWIQERCRDACVETGPNEAMCAESERPEPRCDAAQDFCDGQTRVLCDRGYVTGRYSCSPECGVPPDDPDCFPELACKDPYGWGKPSFCYNKAWQITCDGPLIAVANRCDTVCFQLSDGPGTCARTEDAEPRCRDSVLTFCDGDQLVRCAAGFAIERTDCRSLDPNWRCVNGVSCTLPD